MRKSADAFRTISEVADELDVQKHVLRFWEIKFPQIKPLKRGGGRRYYRPADVELLRGIRACLHSDGYTIKGVQRILREEGVEQVKGRGRTEAEPAPARKAAKKAATAAKSRRTAPEARQIPPDKIKILEKALQELESCRALLKGDAAAKTPRKKATTTRRAAM